MNKAHDPQGIQSLAQELLRYLQKRPNAAETLDDVTQWWASRQPDDESTDIVEDALEYLVANKSIVKRSLGKRTLYMLR